MEGSRPIDNDFLKRIAETIQANISNEMFGVTELAGESGMSRSNLLRKIKRSTGRSANQFIREVRLRKAMELLTQGTLNVSEVSFQVGFRSVSYFIKCFHDYYGYSPGEVVKKESVSELPEGRPHQLAAIMFTDIQGYTALMQRDEDKAVEFRNRHREVFNAATKKYNGRILQYYGDGTLSTFSSAIDAVRCGIDMQLAFCLKPQIPVRIGIHTGDIIVSRDEIIGNGVNIASRIESIATVGSVYISEKVYDEVRNQTGIETVSMGVYELKNVERPVEVYAVVNPGLANPRESLFAKDGNGASGRSKGLLPAGILQRILWTAVLLAAFLCAYLLIRYVYQRPSGGSSIVTGLPAGEKSIAVLPFINDSNDSSNIYIINGLMESILNNLQKIEDLRVISRTSVEKFRNRTRTVPEIASELNVRYFIEGSGQKINDQILLNIQLIDAASDEHLWSEQYKRDTRDIFSLQREVARDIAGKIRVVISPEEEKRINRAPTDNLEAYDRFLIGLELYNKGGRENLEQAIHYFQEAVALDTSFGMAYAHIALSYFFLDYDQIHKQYATEINTYADKALLYDPQLSLSLIAKAVYYIHNGEYELALPHLEKALEYNPNSALVINILSDFYTRYVPNTEKYLEYALKGVRLDIASHDSVSSSFIFLHLSNALIQSGFVEEAVKYINKSLEYLPGNLWSEQVRAYILYAKNGDLSETKKLLLDALEKDTTRIDILQEAGKICYFMRDYPQAYRYYSRINAYREAGNLDSYRSENGKIACVLAEMGMQEASEKYLNDFKDFAEHDPSIYRHLNLALYYSYSGNPDRAIEEMEKFARQDNYFYWTVIFLDKDPLTDAVRNLPAFQRIAGEIKDKFWQNHERIKANLVSKALL